MQVKTSIGHLIVYLKMNLLIPSTKRGIGDWLIKFGKGFSPFAATNTMDFKPNL